MKFKPKVLPSTTSKDCDHEVWSCLGCGTMIEIKPRKVDLKKLIKIAEEIKLTWDEDNV